MFSKITIFFMILFTLSLASACNREKSLSKEKVIQDVVGAMCKKTVQCHPGALPSEEFCKEDTKGLLQANQESFKLEATQKQLDQCVAAIHTMDCQNIVTSTPPKDCDFLNK